MGSKFKGVRLNEELGGLQVEVKCFRHVTVPQLVEAQNEIVGRWLVYHKKLEKTALTIFLKLCPMLDIDKLCDVTEPDFPKKLRFIHKVQKCGQNDTL